MLNFVKRKLIFFFIFVHYYERKVVYDFLTNSNPDITHQNKNA